MSPEEATAAQIERYRAMTVEERLGIALGLHELSCEMARVGIRLQHPDADDAMVERLVHERLVLSRQA